MPFKTGVLTESEQVDLKPSLWPALAVIAGPIFYDLTWLVLGSLTPNYSPVRQTVSWIGVGPYGVWLNGVSVVAGLLLTAGVAALFQRFGSELGRTPSRIYTAIFAVAPLGMVWAGIFDLNSPVHTAVAAIACVLPMFLFPVAGFRLRSIPNWRRFGTGLILSGPLTFFLLHGFTGSVIPSRMAINQGVSGLWQRAVILEIHFWYLLLGRRGLRRSG